jgi:hypothetical protein
MTAPSVARYGPEEVLRALATRLRVATPAELCCRLRSLGWVITMISAVKRRERTEFQRVEQQKVTGPA